MAKVGTSALEDRKLGYLQWSDVIVLDKDELLYVASQQVEAMSESGWRRAWRRALFPVAGRNAIATIKVRSSSTCATARSSRRTTSTSSSLIAEIRLAGANVTCGLVWSTRNI